MSRFLKIKGESVWINIERVDGIMVRPQLQAVGTAHGEGALEELHEATGNYEVAAIFQGSFAPVQVFSTREEAESFVRDILESLG